jgi:hypothetical protein
MHYVLEALVVGIYASALCVVLASFIRNAFVLAFMLGFIKHFLGFFVFSPYYCNKDNSYTVQSKEGQFSSELILQSILEGCVALVVLVPLFRRLDEPQRLVWVFIIGFCAHLLVEWSGSHTQYVEQTCVLKSAFLSKKVE